jgi:uncharacterized membrane protein
MNILKPIEWLVVIIVLLASLLSALGTSTLQQQYYALAYWHLATILPAFVIGTYLMITRKGSTRHRALGRWYMLLMLLTAIISLMIPAQVGPTLWGHFGFIHLFSLFVLYNIPEAWLAIRNKQIRRHANSMIGLYVGGILIAGSLALMPGRLLHTWI